MSDGTVSTLDATVGLSGDSLSPGRLAFRRFLTHRAAVVSVVVLTLLVLWVLLSPFTARYGVNEQVFDISKGANQNLPPSRIAWFGTDIIGRDVYSRVLYGVRVSLIIGIASAFFSLVIGAFGKLMPPEWRTLSFGLGTAAGSFGQFLFSPVSVALIDNVGWHQTLIIYGGIVLAIIPLSLALAMPKSSGSAAASAGPVRRAAAGESETSNTRSPALA